MAPLAIGLIKACVYGTGPSKGRLPVDRRMGAQAGIEVAVGDAAYRRRAMAIPLNSQNRLRRSVGRVVPARKSGGVSVRESP